MQEALNFTSLYCLKYQETLGNTDAEQGFSTGPVETSQ